MVWQVPIQTSLRLQGKGPEVRLKNFSIAGFAVFVVHQLLGGLVGWAIFGVLIGDSLGALPRETAQRMWVMPVMPASGLVWSVIFVQIYGMIRKEGSIREGLLYGLWMGLIVAVPSATNAYVYTPGAAAVPVMTGVIVIGVIQALACGVVLAGIHRSNGADAS